MTDVTKELSGWVAWPLLISFAAGVVALCCMTVFGIWGLGFAWKLAASVAGVSGIIFVVSAFIGWLSID